MADTIPTVPYAVPGQPDGQPLNLYDRLLQQRLIFLNQTVDSAVANQIIASLLYLDAEETGRDIRLYINEIEARELLQLRQLVATLLAQKTGHPIEKILQDTEREAYLSARAALDYGLIDQIVSC